LLVGRKVPELTTLVVTLGGHSVVVLVAGSANVAAVAFVLVLEAVVVDVVAVRAVY
jgi:hypothetical protein